MVNEQMTYEEAKKRVKAMKDFYQHLGIYVVVNAGLAILSLSLGAYWFIYPMLGWGIGLAAHAVSTFSLNAGKDWEERKIKEMMERNQ